LKSFSDSEYTPNKTAVSGTGHESQKSKNYYKEKEHLDTQILSLVSLPLCIFAVTTLPCIVFASQMAE